MGTQEYIKACLIAIGSVFFANGFQMILTDELHIWFGVGMAIFGSILIRKGFRLKSDSKKFFEYLKEAQDYADSKSKIQIPGICTDQERERLGLDFSSYMRFEQTIGNALGCFYDKEVALQMIEGIRNSTPARYVGGVLVNTDIVSIKETYGRLAICLKTLGDHPANRRKEFEISDLKEYSYFLKERPWWEKTIETIF